MVVNDMLLQYASIKLCPFELQSICSFLVIKDIAVDV